MKLRRRPSGDALAAPLRVPDTFESADPRVQGLIGELRATTRVEDLQRALKHLPTDDLQPNDCKLVVSLLAYLFLSVEARHPVRKTVSRMLAQQFDPRLVKMMLAWNINLMIVDCLKEEGFEKHNELVSGLQHCFSNFPLGIEAVSDSIKSITAFLINDYFYNLVDKLKDKTRRPEIHSYVANVSKLLVAILQQCRLSDHLPESCAKLMAGSYAVITDEYVGFDAKSNCGVLMVIAVAHAPDDRESEGGSPCLGLLKFDAESTGGALRFGELARGGGGHSTNLCIYAGILNVVPQALLCEETVDGVPVISFMFGKLLDYAKRCSGKSNQILEVSRCLILISKVINRIPLDYIEPMFKQGFEYVWTHFDHYIDMVRQSARTIFKNLIRLAHEHYKKGNQMLLGLTIDLVLSNMLDCLVNRRTQYIALTILSKETGCSFLIDQFSQLPFVLLINMQDSTLANQICCTYESLMAQHKDEEKDIDKWLRLWVDVIKPLLTSAKPPVVGYYQRLFVSAYRLQPMVLKSIMHYQWYSYPNELGTLLACLRTARQSGLEIPLSNVTTLTPEQISEKYWRGIIEYKSLQRMMCHQNDEIRVHVLGLIVESQKSREIFMFWELAFIQKFFLYNVTTQSPNTRQQLVALYKKIFIRLRDTSSVITRNISNVKNRLTTAPDEAPKEALQKELNRLRNQDADNRRFVITMFQKYLCPGFQAESNYQRRATCLELVLFIITEKCVDEAEIRSMWKKEFTGFLLSLLMDSYESNVRMAFAILKRLPYAISEHFNKNSAFMFLRQTIQNATSLKPDKVTAAGYMLQLCLMTPFAKDLFMKVYRQSSQEDLYTMAMNVFLSRANMACALAKNDLFRSIRGEAFYGDLMCVRNILENNDLRQWTSLAHQIVSTCRSIGEVVAPIVNNDSPEGYIPNDKYNSSSAQMLLVLGWRSVKEVSLLLGELVSRAPKRDPVTDEEVLTVDLLRSIRDYFTQVFEETKHRGAYEQASVGFAKFCKYLWQQPPESPCSHWPRAWLESVRASLRGEDRDTLNKLCPNRRSAGLPFMVVDVVTTEPREARNEAFHFCVGFLLEIAADERSLSLSRVHAMNVLKSLYRHHLLGEMATAYVADGVRVALNAFASDEWAVRNSAFILIAALMQRIFGVQRSREPELKQKNKMSTQVFFMRYPELYRCFLDYLHDGTVYNKNVVVLHPVLLILERLYPPEVTYNTEILNNADEGYQLGEYIKYITNCLENPDYNIRELAAQALASLTPHMETVEYIKTLLLKLCEVTLSDNCCQGTISLITCLLKSLNKLQYQLDVPEIIEGTFWIPISAGRYVSHFTAANYYDMLTLLTRIFLKNCRGAEVFARLVKILALQSMRDSACPTQDSFSTARKKLELARFNLHAHAVQNLYVCDPYFKSLYLKELVMKGFESSNDAVVEYCFNYVTYMYLGHSRYPASSLLEGEVLEISEREHTLVCTMDPELRGYMLENFHLSARCFYIRSICGVINNGHDLLRGMLLSIRHYPCVMDMLSPSKQEVLNFLICFCEPNQEECFCAALNCISSYLSYLNLDDLLLLSFRDLFGVLVFASMDSSPAHLRMAIAEFLVTNRRLYTEKEFFKNVDIVMNSWIMVLQLLDDDDQDVRNTMSGLATKIRNNSQHVSSTRENSDPPIISEKAKEEIFEACTTILPRKISIALFLSLIFKTLDPKPMKTQPNSGHISELFESSADNAYFEREHFARLALRWFKTLLWRLDDGLSYADRTIFVEEHVLLVATAVLNVLYAGAPRHVDAGARLTLMCVLKKVKDHVERADVGADDFRKRLHALIARAFAGLGVNGKDHPSNGKIQEIVCYVFDIE